MAGSRRSRLRRSLFFAVAALAVGLSVGAYAGRILRPLELATVDARFSLREAKGPPADVVVVQIDDVTFSDLGVQWPFRRSLHGRVIDRLVADGARAIAYDVQFTEPTQPEEDDALIEAVARAGNVVLATTEVDDAGRTNVFGGEDVLRQIGARAANALLAPDSGGVIRRFEHSVDGLESLAVAAAEVATGEVIPPARFDGGARWIDFAGPPGTVTTTSFSRVLEGKTPPGLFRGKVVVVGPSAPSLQDVHPTTTSGDGLMSGAELQANAVATVLEGFPLESSSKALNVLMIVLLALVAPITSLRLEPLRALALALAAGLAFVVASQLLFDEAGTILLVSYPLLALVLASVGSLAVNYLLAAFERERVRDVFSRFVPEKVVDQVLLRTDRDLRLGGTRLVGTVMFSDLRGFTTFAESLPADRVIEALNFYLTQMSDAIQDNGGTLVAYMGDGIMAVFGAPIEQEDHADRALAAAREMLEVRLPRFNDWLAGSGVDTSFRMGIGLNSGPIMSGNVGSERRLEYTAIGDTTNTAARLEGMTKGTPYSLFVTESTRDSLADVPEDLFFVDEVEVRGRQASIRLWALAEPVSESGPSALPESPAIVP
jgi:adenylate cyclase